MTIPPTPVFDTNVFIDVSRGAIPLKDWRIVRSAASRKGWPVSAVTLGELLLGLARSPKHAYAQALEPLRLARQLSRGRVLPDPFIFAMDKTIGGPCGRVTFSPAQMENWFLVACVANSRTELEEQGVAFRPGLYRGRKIARLNLTKIQEMLEARQKQFIEGISRRLDAVYPNWRANRGTNRKTLPKEAQEQFVRHSDPEQWKIDLALGILSWVSDDPDEAMARRLAAKIDAVLVLLDSLATQVATSDYKFEERLSDAADILQLYYLVDERFCFVTQDKRLLNHIKGSAQENRVFDFRTFTRRLAESS